MAEDVRKVRVGVGRQQEGSHQGTRESGDEEIEWGPGAPGYDDWIKRLDKPKRGQIINGVPIPA